MLYVLAPMDGITDSAYRQIVKKIWHKYKKDSDDELLLYTEFVSSDWFVHNFEGVKHHLDYINEEKPLICQIFGSNLQKLLYTAKKIEKNYDFDGIDLNIGCPAPKIIKTGAGSALMINKENTLEIVKTLSENLKIPFSIKTRIGINEADKHKQLDFIIKASNFCKIIAIHARTLVQYHSWEPDIDFVLKVKQLVNPNCKIIFNWWVTQDKLVDKTFMEKMSLLDGIMIWQAAIGNPWIFVGVEPSWKERKQTILEHLQLNIQAKWGRKWVVEFRKFIGSYIKWIPNASKYRSEFMKIDSFDDFVKIINKITE